MRAFWATAPGLLLLSACAGLMSVADAARVVAPAAPPRLVGVQLALKADALRIAIEAAGSERGLELVFAGPALADLRTLASRLARRRQHFETQNLAETVVHWSGSAGAAAVVVESSGRERLVAPEGTSAWDRFVDQWSYVIRWDGGWRVWSAAGLPPDQWWPV